jgi:hypothetical protein
MMAERNEMAQSTAHQPQTPFFFLFPLPQIHPRPAMRCTVPRLVVRIVNLARKRKKEH